LAKYLLLVVLLSVGHVFAIDEDYEIPYTDNYGYVYDPETGQFVKQDQSTPESGDTSAGANVVDVSKNNAGQALTETPLASQGSLTFYLLIGAGIALLIVAAVTFLAHRKSGMVN